ncbi:hypothetical protein [Bacillus infantis]|uniref:hypothetical protein n=1 Tax=Bacillus infantis TaxID=324767 RepID=UPI000925F809|nr:hypothetical protein [Bacillus infantis]MCK6204895.1 hypothetical protein [Bacillus infantis]SIG64030.1 Uncharacterised protein [Mycobacteroides abscessus subsp. abscessus]
MSPQKLIILLVLIIVLLSTAAEFIFEGVSARGLFLLAATAGLTFYLWKRPEREK